MDLLKELHADGATICMVTHDPRYARYAERTIHLFDGQVVRDEATAQAHELEESGFEIHQK
jgi:putative ABC transport system ATP-binding protein